ALDKQLNAALIEAAPLMVNFYENMAAVVRVSRDWSTALDDIPGKLNEIGNSSVFRDLVDLMDSAGLIDRDAIDAINRRLNGGAAPAADSNTSNGFRTVGSFGGPAGRIAAGFDLFPDRQINATSAPDAFSSTNVFKAERMALAELTSELDNTTRAHREAASVFREAEGAARDLTKGFETAQEQGAALGAALQSATSGLVSDLMNGVDAMDALKAAGIRVAQQFIEMQLQAALFGRTVNGVGAGGGGLLGALLGPVFGGFRADGGPVEAGKIYGVGERGPEWFVPQQPGQIVPQETLQKVVRAEPRSQPAEAAPVTVTMTVQAADSESFRGSETQIAGRLVDAIQRGRRGR
ncbi:MAG: hypothetical protein JJ902_22960, partial [Roseibium sp.]|nr:hypothetical protein [Roseibium sp.]